MTVAVADALRERTFELRFDPETRKVSGVALQYGDVADLPWGKERFEPGAFGELGNADVILDIQHQRDRAVARTNGGGMVLADSLMDLRMEARLAKTSDGDDAIVLIQDKILRGLSVGFRVRTSTYDRDEEIEVISEADLVRIGIVDTPAYPKSTIMRERARREEASMGDETTTNTNTDALQEAGAELLRTVREQLQAEGGTDADLDARAEALVEKLTAANQGAVAAALKERDEAEAERAKAEAEKVEAEKATEAEREKLQKEAEERAELLVMLAPLLPKDTETRGKTNHELMVLAAGDEIANAAERSADYLLAKLEGIIERRAIAAKQGTPNPNQDPQEREGEPMGGPQPFNLVRMIEQRDAKQAAAGRA